MIRIAICDDDIRELEHMYALATRYAKAHGESAFFVRRFHSSYDLLECIESPERRFNIYLLDIVMPMFDGLEVGGQIRRVDRQAVIVYVSSSEEYALKSFDMTPLQYLVKPVEYSRFEGVLSAACGRIAQAQEAAALVRVKEGLCNIRFHQILFLEYSNHAVLFHLTGGKTLYSTAIRESFAEYAEKYLADARFIRPHVSFVVNMDHVSALAEGAFTMIDGQKVPVSKRVLAATKKRFIDYMVGKGAEISV